MAFAPLNFGNVRKMHEQIASDNKESSGFTKASFFKANDGQNIIRFLPPIQGAADFVKRVGYHSVGVYPNQTRLVCMKQTFGENCQVCNALKDYAKNKGPESIKLYMPKGRYLFNVLDLKKADGKVYVAEFGPQLANPVFDFLTEMEYDITGFDVGYNYKFSKVKKGAKTTYEQLMIIPKAHDLGSLGYTQEKIEVQMYDLEKVPFKPRPDDVGSFMGKVFDALKNGSPVPESDELPDIPKLQQATIYDTMGTAEAAKHVALMKEIEEKGLDQVKAESTARRLARANATPPVVAKQEAIADDFSDVDAVEKPAPMPEVTKPAVEKKATPKPAAKPKAKPAPVEEDLSVDDIDGDFPEVDMDEPF